MKLLYKCNSKLVSERTKVPKSSLLTVLNCALLMMQLSLQVLGRTLLRLPSISFPKTKLLVAGSGITEGDLTSLSIGSSVSRIL